MDAQKITVETVAAAPVEKAWATYTKPEHITQWNYASDDWSCPLAEADLRLGGTYKTRMEAKDGSVGFDFEGRYQEIDPLRAISLVLSDGRVMRTTFEEADDRTRIATTFDADAQSPIDVQRDGWQAILTNFKRHIEAGR